MTLDFSPEALKRRLERWLAEGGAKALFEAHRRSEVARKELAESMRLDHETLNKPMTI